jgi:hypothetical protein
VETGSHWSGGWALLLAGSIALIGAVDATLLGLGKAYFGSGFNSVYIEGAAQMTAFFVCAAVLDLVLVLAVWAVFLPILRRLRFPRLSLLCLAGVLAVVVPFSLDFVHYRLHVVLGDILDVRLLWEVSGQSLSSSAAEALSQFPSLVLILVLAAAGVALLLWVTRRLDDRLHPIRDWLVPPRTASLWVGFLSCAMLGTAILAISITSAPRIHYGLVRKPSAVLLSQLVQKVTDLDRDGFGFLSMPPDADPFDSSLYAYAVDLPGNGIDENGLAGDHPTGFERIRPVGEAGFRGEGRPHLLVIFLESFRGDLIGRRHGDREVTPFLNRLAREGASSSRAYVHSPYTAGSRGQLFGGRLVAYPGQDTLIDGLHDRGYFVAYFSGADESFADGEAMIGFDRADLFYDGRQDKDRRTSRSSNPISLQVSWKLVNQRVFEFLEDYDPATPLFLYVNFVDTHFPYHHAEIDDLLGVEPIPRSEIRAKRVERVWDTYLNAAANVDRAAEALLERWWQKVGRHHCAILVTADHGQSIYDSGFLGHGQSVATEQTRVPLILWGIGGDWPEPVGISDIRGLLRRNLPREPQESPPQARFVPDANRRIFQYMAAIEYPKFLGLRGLERTAVYEFRSGRLSHLGPDDEPLQLPKTAVLSDFEALIRNWEALRGEARPGDDRGSIEDDHH